MNVAVYGKYVSHEQLPMLRKVFEGMFHRGWSVYVKDTFLKQFERTLVLSQPLHQFSTEEELVHHAKILFSIGGDGTFLETIMLVRDSGIPVFGINMGRLGFLSAISTDEIAEAFQLISRREFYIEPRTMLRLNTPGHDLYGRNNFALNEVSITTNHPKSMIAVSVWVNGVFLNTYQSDGLLISTPTGSTAYNLSCNGNILYPGTKNFIITPIAPHNLTVRPIVLPDDCTIKIVIERTNGIVSIGMDSRYCHVESPMELLVEKEEFHINIARLADQHFFSTLRNKLNWGLDSRNLKYQNK